MDRVVWVRIASALVVASVVASDAAGAPAPVPGATATAQALAVRIVFPDGRAVGSGSGAAASYAYPASGSVVVTGSIEASTGTQTGKTAHAQASSAARP